MATGTQRSSPSGLGSKIHRSRSQKRKMTTQERIAYLIDEGTSYFEVGTLVNWGRDLDEKVSGAGVFTGFCQIDGNGQWSLQMTIPLPVVLENKNTGVFSCSRDGSTPQDTCYLFAIARVVFAWIVIVFPW